jgi:hypothetical protein
MQVIHLAGLPFETADSEELNYRKAVRDVMLRGLSPARASPSTTTSSAARSARPGRRVRRRFSPI